jgi:hypothetical protein
MATNQTSTKDLFLRSIAVLGLIAVLLLGAWGIIQIAVRLPAFFSGIGSALSGAFSREEAPRATTTPTTPAVTPATTTPVKPAANPAKPASPQQPVASYTPSGNRTNLYGSPDLTVRVLSLNSLSSVQGRSVAQFEVSNVGTNVAPRNWNFVAELPIQGGYPYYSAGQQALYPGDRIVYTLTFDEGHYGYGGGDYCAAIYPPPPGCGSYWDGGHFSVTVDPYNQLRESNDFNNTAAAGY